MKILIVSQYYWPEQFQINEIAPELVRRGHEGGCGADVFLASYSKGQERVGGGYENIMPATIKLT